MTFLSVLYNRYKRIASPKHELHVAVNSALELAAQIKSIDAQLVPVSKQIQVLEAEMKKQNSAEMWAEHKALVEQAQDLLAQRKPLAESLSQQTSGLRQTREEVYSGELSDRPSSTSSTGSLKRQGSQ